MRALTYLGVGAGLMYFFDPERGRRRRVLARDQCIHWAHQMEDAIEVTARDLSHRATGLAAEARAMVSSDNAPDMVIEARVRSALGRATSHPKAIRVEVRGGRVMLSGPVLAAEVENVVRAAWSARGVRGVASHLEVHQRAGDHPALQGGSPRPGARPELLQKTWSPTARLLVGLAGGMLALKAARRPRLTGLAIGALGIGVAAGVLANAPPRAGRRRATERAGSPDMAMPWVSP